MQTISTLVQITKITRFTRVNEHTPTPVEENFLAVWMDAIDNPMVICPLVNFTREDTEFGIAALETPTTRVFRLGAQVKEAREDEHGPRLVVTHCKMGGFKTKTAAQRKVVRIEKMNKKLGLTA